MVIWLACSIGWYVGWVVQLVRWEYWVVGYMVVDYLVGLLARVFAGLLLACLLPCSFCLLLALTEHDALCPAVVRARKRSETLLARRVPDGHFYSFARFIQHLHLRGNHDVLQKKTNRDKLSFLERPFGETLSLFYGTVKRDLDSEIIYFRLCERGREEQLFETPADACTENYTKTKTHTRVRATGVPKIRRQL